MPPCDEKLSDGQRLTAREHRRLADLLLAGGTLPPLTTLSPEIRIGDAEQIRDLVLQERIAAGEQVIGAKALGEGRMAWMTSGMLLDGGAADISTLVRPRAIPRLAFRLGSPLPGGDAAAVLAATEQIMPCLDIVECRFKGAPARPADTVAENGGTALVKLGDGIVPTEEHDRIRLQLRVDGLASEHHSTPQHDVGDLLLAVSGLGGRLDEAGLGAGAGALLVSPAIGPAVSLLAGVRVIAHASGIGTVELDIVSA